MQVRRGGRVAEGAALEMPCTGNCTVGSNPTPSAIKFCSWRRLRRAPALDGRADNALAGFGGVTERPKVRHWKCRARVTPVPRVQIPPPPPLICGVTVLDGELAVPCNPQSASAGSNSLSRAARVE